MRSRRRWPGASAEVELPLSAADSSMARVKAPIILSARISDGGQVENNEDGRHDRTSWHRETETPKQTKMKNDQKTENPQRKKNTSTAMTQQAQPQDLGGTPVDGDGSNLHRHQCSSCPLGRGPLLTLPSLRTGQTLELGASAVSVGI